MSATRSVEFDVKDIGLAGAGKQRIEWAEREMPVLRVRVPGAASRPDHWLAPSCWPVLTSLPKLQTWHVHFKRAVLTLF